MIADKERLLLKVFYDYYVRNLTQTEIAGRHLISRKKVQRYLEEGRNENLVEVKIKFPARMYGQLESELEDKYSLREVIISDVDEDDPNNLAISMRNIGDVAADYFLRVLAGKSTVFFAWSGHIAEMLDNASRKVAAMRDKPKDVKLILTPGSMIGMEPDLETLDAAVRMSQTLNAKLHVLMAPGLTATSASRLALISDPEISSLLDDAKKADISFFGVGSIDGDSRMLPAANKFFPSAVTTLKKKGAVGDINGHFFNSNGEAVPSELDENMVGLGIADIKELPLVVGLGRGPSKFIPLKSMLSANMFHVLITDIGNARKLVEG